ncbi:hypothetical protein SAY87_019675 [Trapa incisa]|uniref:Uncharacterized protein n=1 Tax=Trapa incisa TaxID=236973 RepID=A0AAN7Q3A5_9MYRT|nr:hypothetical protein SAY87_019675 [Trapa incisa]
MGKNQAYKAMQRARVGSSSAVPEQIEDGMVDGSFHSPEWHAARLANLKTSHTVTWEEFKRKQKDDEMKKGELEADTDRMMREYRAQLDAERACKLAQGRNHSSTKSKGGKDRKERDSKRCGSKRKIIKFLMILTFGFSNLLLLQRSHRDSISSNSSSDSWSSDEDEREQKRSRSKHRRRKDRKHRRKESGSNEEDGDGPLPLSRFFEDSRLNKSFKPP